VKGTAVIHHLGDAVGQFSLFQLLPGKVVQIVQQCGETRIPIGHTQQGRAAAGRLPSGQSTS